MEVDLAALVANARTLRARAERPLLAMVKANGYGLGAVAVARALEDAEPWGFGVATPDEGVELRSAGIVRPIVVFTPLLPSWIETLRAHRLTPAIGDRAALGAWLAAGPAPFHLEIDTGMARGGLPFDDLPGLVATGELLANAGGWEGVFTHYHSAEEDPAAVRQQWARLHEALTALPRRPAYVHAANSAAALAYPAEAGDLVRGGIFLYGGATLGPADAPVSPRPVARLRARVVAVRALRAGESVSYGATWTATRPTRVATLAIGYADGLPRSLSNRGFAELGGRVTPLVGRVTMDMTMVAVPDGVPVAPGDAVTLWGGRVSLASQALAAGTITYELLTTLGPRIDRRYVVFEES